MAAACFKANIVGILSKILSILLILSKFPFLLSRSPVRSKLNHLPAGGHDHLGLGPQFAQRLRKSQ